MNEYLGHSCGSSQKTVGDLSERLMLTVLPTTTQHVCMFDKSQYIESALNKTLPIPNCVQFLLCTANFRIDDATNRKMRQPLKSISVLCYLDRAVNLESFTETWSGLEEFVNFIPAVLLSSYLGFTCYPTMFLIAVPLHITGLQNRCEVDGRHGFNIPGILRSPILQRGCDNRKMIISEYRLCRVWIGITNSS